MTVEMIQLNLLDGSCSEMHHKDNLEHPPSHPACSRGIMQHGILRNEDVFFF